MADYLRILEMTEDSDIEQLLDTTDRPVIEQLLDTLKKYRQEYENQSTLLEKATSDCVRELYSIADDIDNFHKNAVIANVAGSAVGIAGGIATLAGIVLAPVTLGASLAISTAGIVAATAGGVTGVSASIADSINTKNKCEKVDEKVKETENMINTVQKTASNITDTIEKMKTATLVEQAPDVARMGGKGVFVAVEIGRLAQLARITSVAAKGTKLAAQGARAVRAISGVFAALFVVVDAAFVIKGAAELKEGAKTETAADIRKIADNLKAVQHDMQENNKSLLAEIMGLISELSEK